jgi:NAD(P)-dependent dehydrogenase (short-subunit alcohol dehydrogenase family)
VVVADLDGAGAEAVAAELNDARPGSALGLTADVGSEDGNVELINAAIDRFGPIDLFFANAGVAVGIGLDTSEPEWDLAFRVNSHAHRWAAKHLVPAWIERGEGYFCSTASAAGLLTKHAAVAFAEWLAITYGDHGVAVTCLCPMGVNTNLLSGAGGIDQLAGSVVKEAGAVLEPEAVAEITLEAIAAERFLVLPHPEVATFFQRKAADHDRWIDGMRRLQARVRSSG